MDDTDSRYLPVPTPPPWPADRPVPLDWNPWDDDARRQERDHRLAALNGACLRCADPPGSPPFDQFLRKLARPRPPDAHDHVRPGHLSTPEGELASFMHGRPRVEPRDREAVRQWASTTLTPIGGAFAHVVDVDGWPWVRALLWFDDEEELHLESSSLDRYLHLEITLQRLWPPVFRGSRAMSSLDERLDAPFRPTYPAPPAEASAFTRLSVAPDTPFDHDVTR